VAFPAFRRRRAPPAALSRDDGADDMVRARSRATTRERYIIFARCARSNAASTRASTRGTTRAVSIGAGLGMRIDARFTRRRRARAACMDVRARATDA